MSRLVGITGYSQAGKDTFGSVLVEAGWTRRGMADALKEEVADYCGLTVEELERRKEEFRATLQCRGARQRRKMASWWANIWRNWYMLEGIHMDVVVTDVRFQNEAAIIRVWDGVVIRVRRADQDGPAYAHPSETELDSIVPDLEFTSHSAEGARQAARDFLGRGKVKAVYGAPVSDTHEGMRQCIECGQWFPEDKTEFAPDPYSEEVCDDNTPVWECDSCRCERAMDA